MTSFVSFPAKAGKTIHHHPQRLSVDPLPVLSAAEDDILHVMTGLIPAFRIRKKRRVFRIEITGTGPVMT
jgi:hypothetical protein